MWRKRESLNAISFRRVYICKCNTLHTRMLWWMKCQDHSWNVGVSLCFDQSHLFTFILHYKWIFWSAKEATPRCIVPISSLMINIHVFSPLRVAGVKPCSEIDPDWMLCPTSRSSIRSGVVSTCSDQWTDFVKSHWLCCFHSRSG